MTGAYRMRPYGMGCFPQATARLPCHPFHGWPQGSMPASPRGASRTPPPTACRVWHPYSGIPAPHSGNTARCKRTPFYNRQSPFPISYTSSKGPPAQVGLSSMFGFPLGGSCQRPRPLTDEGQPCRCRPLSGCRGTRAPHPALRGCLPPRGKASRTLNSPQTRNIPRRSPRPRRCPRSPSTNTQCQNSSTCLSQGMRLCRRCRRSRRPGRGWR